jgi:archaellum component FlaC
MDVSNCPNDVKMWYHSASENDKIKALVIGYHIVSNGLHKVCEDEIEALRQEYTNRTQTLETEYKTNIDAIKEQRSKDIDFYANKFLSIPEIYLQKYDDKLNNYRQDEITSLKSQISTLNTKLAVMQSTNFYKGEEGENYIKTILNTHFISYEIKDTSSQSKTADIHLIAPNNKFIAIESKNKQTITAIDIRKTLEDIKNLKQTDDFIGYLFVSMKSNNIPKKGNLCYEIIDDIPVIWYATNNHTYLERDIINLIKILFMHKNKQNINELTTSLTESFNRIQNLKKIIEDSLKSLTSLKTNITEIKTSINYIYDDIFKILNT